MKYLLTSILLVLIIMGCKNVATVETPKFPEQPGVTIKPLNTSSAPTAPVTTPLPALPAFRMLNAGNQVIDLSQFKGKKVFVNLWATWCPPCREEIPSIENLGAKSDKSKVEFVLLSLDDNFEKAKLFAVKNNMKLPVYSPAGNLPSLFTVDGIPATFIFNEKGDIIYQQMGTVNYDTKEFLAMLNN